MIHWRKYNPTDRSIESHRNHLVSDGRNTLVAWHASVPGTGECAWRINNSIIGWVTHWAPINLPESEETE